MLLETKHRLTKVLSIVAFTFVILALTVIVRTPPTSGYEISLYWMYPWYFWALIIMSIFVGQLILIINAVFYDENDRAWVYGFLSIFVTDVILLFMPFIRGYSFFGRHDELTHMGWIVDVIKTGHSSTNFYPVDHFLCVALHYITGIPVNSIMMLIPAIFSIIYLISLYLLANQLFPRKSLVLFILAFSSILLISHDSLSFAPSAQSFFLLPFILFIYFKSRSYNNHLEFRGLLVILLCSFVFFHPEDSLFLILILLILELCLLFYKKFEKKQNIGLLEQKPGDASRAAFMTFVIFSAWYTSSYRGLGTFHRVLDLLLYGGGSTDLLKYSGMISMYHVSLADLLEIAINNYGQLIILGVLSLVSSIYIFYNLGKNRIKAEERANLYVIFFSIGFLIFLIITIIFFVGRLPVGFERILKYVLLFSSILSGLSLYLLLTRGVASSKIRYFRYIATGAILLLLVYFSIFNLYWSPIVKKENQQVADSEIKGMAWFFSHQNKDLQSQELGINQVRFFDARYGIDSVDLNVDYFNYAQDISPPDHFGRENQTLLGSYYKDPCYLTMSYLGTIVYPNMYPNYEKYWRFTSLDFKALDIDMTTAKVYNNSNLDVYLILPQTYR